jgi:hypothetical protein
MIKTIDCSSWSVWDDGMTEGSGRSEKEWLISENGQICLFKYPKSLETTEHVSEHLACQIGKILGIETAEIDLGYRKGRMGSISYKLNSRTEELVEGIWFISGPYPRFNADKLIDEESGQHYCLQMIETSLRELFNQQTLSEMLLFDFLIGNTDRHQSNWAILVETVEQRHNATRPCPLYDNGSSLCCYTTEKQINQINHHDKSALLALADTKSRSRIRIDGNSPNLPTHKEMIRHVLKRYDCALQIAQRILDNMTKEAIIDLLSQYPITVLPENRRALICVFLEKKVEILRELVREVGGL